MSGRPKPPILTTIQAARGIAAVAVVLHHTGAVLGFPQYLGYVPLRGIFQAGHAAVDFFFVLSGFVIATAHADDVGKSQVFSGYLWKRMVRIYPFYWAALLITIVVASYGLLAPGIPPDKIDARYIFLSAFLLPQHTSPFLPVAWTLQHEVLFYIVFGVAILNRRLGTIVLCAWFAGCLLSALFAVDRFPFAPENLVTNWLFSSFHLQFALGLLSRKLVFNERIAFPKCTAAVGLVGLLLTAMLEEQGVITTLSSMDRLFYGVFSASLICGLAASERLGYVRAWSALVFIGAASFSIYLMHTLICGAFPRLTDIHQTAGWVVMLEMTACAIILGVLAHLVIERPILSWSRRLLRTSAAKSA